MQEILQKIKPSKEEKRKLQQSVNSFLDRLNSKLNDAKAILGGSGAKGTFLAGSYDVDIFVQYDYKKFQDKSEELSDYLEKSLQSSFPKYPLTRLHGSRDYFQLKYEDYTFEIVPILKIKKAEEAKNITDISPLHAIWVNKNVKDKDQVLLIKQFCKAHNIYGAESHIMGFSGYGLEILIGKYKTFTNLLKTSQQWKAKEVIDPQQHYKKGMALFHLNQSKQLSPIIIIDPVDKTRNAAAALSEEKLTLFKTKAKEFLKKPSEEFFLKKEIDCTQLKKEAEQKKQHLIFFSIIPLAGKKDIIGAKLLKAYHFLEKLLQPITIKKSCWDWNSMYFILEQKELPSEKIRKGPPMNLPENVLDFKKKNKNTFVKDGEIYAKIKTPFPKLDDFSKHLITEKYVTEKVKKIKIKE